LSLVAETVAVARDSSFLLRLIVSDVVRMLNFLLRPVVSDVTRSFVVPWSFLRVSGVFGEFVILLGGALGEVCDWAVIEGSPYLSGYADIVDHRVGIGDATARLKSQLVASVSCQGSENPQCGGLVSVGEEVVNARCALDLALNAEFVYCCRI